MNAYQDESGTWQSYVQVRRRFKPELWEVIDRSPVALEAAPDTRYERTSHGYLRRLKGEPTGPVVEGGTLAYYTRIYLGIAPPRGPEPGYCAVVGELFDGKYRAVQRRYYLLDEGLALDADPSLALLPDLFSATAALKDLYRPDLLYLPPGEEHFLEDLRKSKWGICSYPAEEEVSDPALAEQFPFYVSRERVCAPVVAPYAEDEEYVRRLVGALLQRRLLAHHASCPVFAEGQYRTPNRALGQALLAMQAYDWTEEHEDPSQYDGYPIEDATEDEEEEAEEGLSVQQAILYAVGDKEIRRQVLEGTWEMDPDERREWRKRRWEGLL